MYKVKYKSIDPDTCGLTYRDIKGFDLTIAGRVVMTFTKCEAQRVKKLVNRYLKNPGHGVLNIKDIYGFKLQIRSQDSPGIYCVSDSKFNYIFDELELSDLFALA